jgi:arylsulfatase A-like enzyme
MVRDRRWKYVHRYAYGPHELYDLEADPGEEHNLAEDPAARRTLEAMKARLDAFFVRYADPARDGSREAVFGSGQIDLAGPAGEGRRAFEGPLPS